jgi:hypothetical protein
MHFNEFSQIMHLLHHYCHLLFDYGSVSFPSQQQLQNRHLLHELILRTILSDLLYFVVNERLEKQCVSSYNHMVNAVLLVVLPPHLNMTL